MATSTLMNCPTQSFSVSSSFWAVSFWLICVTSFEEFASLERICIYLSVCIVFICKCATRKFSRSKSSGQPLFLSIKFNFVVCALMLDKNHKKLCLKLSSLLRSAAGKIHCGRARLSCHDLPEVVRLINNHRLLDRFPAVSGRCTVFYSCAEAGTALKIHLQRSL